MLTLTLVDVAGNAGQQLTATFQVSASGSGGGVGVW